MTDGRTHITHGSLFDHAELARLVAEYEQYLADGRRWSKPRADDFRSRFAAFGIDKTAIADELLTQAKALLNAVDWERLAHHFAAQLVDTWHAGDPPSGSLAEWMGFTDEQYAAWVETRYMEVLRG